MKEFELPIGDFGTGLRRDSRRERNTLRFVEFYNVVPMEDGVDFVDPILSLNTTQTWGGLGKDLPGLATRTVTIDVTDYVDGSDIDGVSVYLDGVLKGTTDANGELDIADVAVGGHTIKLVKTGYLDSDADTLLNDYILVT